MKPIEPVALRPPIGSGCAVLGAALLPLLAGCLLGGAPRVPQTHSSASGDADARRAGALALMAQGLLYESGEGGETNRAKAQSAALTAFRQAVRLDPDSREPLDALLNVLASREQFAEGFAAAEGFLTRHPDDTAIRIEAARLAEAADRPLEAARHCSRLMEIEPGNRELALARIRLYFTADCEREALEAMREYHARFRDRGSAVLPAHWAVHFLRERESNPARALRCVGLALAQAGGETPVWRGGLHAVAAECHLGLARTNDALASLHAACREDPGATGPVLRLGAIWATDPDATNRLAARALRDPDTAPTRLILAAVHQEQNNRPAAIATLREHYTRRLRAGYFPDERFYLWLAGLIEAEQDPAATERILREALTVHPTSDGLQNFLAYLWAEQGVRLEEADRLVTEALQTAPDNAAYLDTKGWILFKRNRPYDALQFLLKAADLDRDEPVILDHTGDVLQAIGRSAEAVAFWTRSHQIDPTPAVTEKLRRHGVPPKPPAP
ncbi:MAG: hypothetical protein RBT78_11150 [Kiritimatiellia bacterium]|jgi:tetratricopeptide (TPR) repeat protein|nr:hypothetical protein [Kiritimatiellia bacterium]